MNRQTYLATAGGLLHDVGKLVYGAGVDGRGFGDSGAAYLERFTADKALLDCVRCRDGRALCGAGLPQDASAYAVYAAEKIVAGTDRREADAEGFDPSQPLRSIFSAMPQCRATGLFPAVRLQPEKVTFPRPLCEGLAGKSAYADLLAALSGELAKFPMQEDYLNSLLFAMESCCSFVPAFPAEEQAADVSLFDHAKLTAAVAACISEYMQDGGVTDWGTALLTHGGDFCDEPAFLLHTADLSGIQKFLYNIPSKGALKSLKSRSLALELLLEHYIDELLEQCGLSRANLIYSGGGHCYVLLPNTKGATAAARQVQSCTNKWLREQFGVSLFLAGASVPATANELMNRPAKSSPLKNLFISLSRAVSKNKLRRFSAEELLELNAPRSFDGLRECRVCGRSDRLVENDAICPVCKSFLDIAAPIGWTDLVMPVTEQPLEGQVYLELPGADGLRYLHFCHESYFQKYPAEGNKTVRVYTKNRASTNMRFARNIYIGDYAYGNATDLQALAEDAEGIKRLAVLRADVDNLGAAFLTGFTRAGDTPDERERSETLSRKAAFSRQMSLFFRCYINTLLKNGARYRLGDRSQREKRVAVVYSGGDDLFIVGGWLDVLEAGLEIRAAFQRFSCGALTLSAGIGLYPLSYPIAKSASESGELEDAAKAYPDAAAPKKNAAALFEAAQTYSWDVLEKQVIGEKLETLKTIMKEAPTERQLGKAILYKMLALLRSGDERINLARFAYLLARLEPQRREQKPDFQIMSKKLYGWACSPSDRRQLITAIYLYVYQTRGGDQDDKRR